MKKLIIWSALAFFAMPAMAQLDAGKRELHAENYRRASLALANEIRTNPANGAAYYYMGEAAYNLGLVDSARYYYQRGSDAVATEPLNFVGLGKIALDTKKPADAKTLFDKAAKMGGKKNATILVEIGRAYTNSKNLNIDQAVTYINNAITLDKKNADYYVALGDAHLARIEKGGNAADALTAFDNAIAINGKDPRAFVRKAKVNKSARIYKDIEPQLTQALAVDSLYAPAYEELGEYYLGTRKLDQATYYYRRFLELSDKNRPARIRYAQFLYLKKDYVAASQSFIKLLKEDSSHNVYNDGVLRLLAYSAYESGNPKGGLYYMTKFMSERDTTLPILGLDYKYLAQMQLATNQDSLGFASLEKAIASDSSLIPSIGVIADSAYVAKNYAKAIRAFNLKKKVYWKGLNSLDLGYLGASYIITKQYAKADETFAEFISKYPESPAGYLYRARANANMDPDSKKGLALPHYQKYIEIAGKDEVKNKANLVEAWSAIGFFYFQNKQNTEAKAAYEKVKQLDPSNANANKVLSALEKK